SGQNTPVPVTPVTTLNEAADRYYTYKETSGALEDKRNKLAAAVRAGVAKAEKRLAQALDQKMNAEDFEDERIKGEILTANLYRIMPGDKTLAAENYYADPPAPIEIPLDATLSPAKQAQRFYKRYQKKKKALEFVTPQIEAAQNSLDYFESVQVSLQAAETLSDLDEIAEELCKSGIIKETKNEKRKTKNGGEMHLSGVKRTEFEGYLILTGKNNTQNDALVKLSAPNDVWLHTKNIHGAHTVIVNPAKTLPPESVLKRAASLTALYSKAAASENVPVDYTFIKFVSKPKSAAPGKVVYTNQRTVYVNPMK
ncbi:MAG: NFACT family protein, partial [Firmicutes bacterium]|nr:NFACT family protein [Bacillota bacterium]